MLPASLGCVLLLLALICLALLATAATQHQGARLAAESGAFAGYVDACLALRNTTGTAASEGDGGGVAAAAQESLSFCAALSPALALLGTCICLPLTSRTAPCSGRQGGTAEGEGARLAGRRSRGQAVGWRCARRCRPLPHARRRAVYARQPGAWSEQSLSAWQRRRARAPCSVRASGSISRTACPRLPARSTRTRRPSSGVRGQCSSPRRLSRPQRLGAAAAMAAPSPSSCGCRREAATCASAEPSCARLLSRRQRGLPPFWATGSVGRATARIDCG
ncbi:hypothetical protein T492DRAFT_435925 [Pavlovales sp. CCMP2436]|nr:hypothetical protein T492DRAFT_435925 [Pavlovales sp. CCMP2436]